LSDASRFTEEVGVAPTLPLLAVFCLADRPNNLAVGSPPLT